MVTLLLLTWLQATPAQPPPAPAPQTAAPRTQPARPRAQTAPPAAPGTTISFTVTDSVGAVLEGVKVTLIGTADRQGDTTNEGRLRLQNVPAGTYRARFEREGFFTFEKEITWRAGMAPPAMIVTLNAAPPPPAPPEPPPAPAPPKGEMTLPPPSDPKSMALLDYIERNFITNKEPQKENLVGCSGVGQSVLWQVREPWSDREHPSADAMLYIIGGEGTLQLGGKDVNIAAGSFAVVPRGTGYGFVRRGRNPLIVLAFLAGAPCAGD
jgi:Carboxypeptidase regulatory-like domain/Cupin domain